MYSPIIYLLIYSSILFIDLFIDVSVYLSPYLSIYLFMYYLCHNAMIFKRNSQSPCPATRPTPSPCSLSANARHVAACRPWWAGCMLDKPNVITAARATIAEPSQFADKTLAGQDPDLQSSLPLRLTWIRLRGLLIQPKDCFFWLQFAGFGKNTTREVLYLHSWDTGGKLTLHGGHCPRCVARLAHALYCCPQMFEFMNT